MIDRGLSSLIDQGWSSSINQAEVEQGALASSIEAPVHKNGIWKELFYCITCILSFMHPDVGYGKKVRYNLAFS